METMDSQKEKDPFAAIRGMSFDTMKAYFYDIYERNQVFKRQDKLNTLGVQFTSQNCFDVLDIEESEDVEDDTYVFYCGDSVSLQRTKCGRHPKLTLDSKYRDTLDGFDKEVFTHTINPDKEIIMEVMITHDKIPIQIPTNTLLDSSANVIFIDRKWAEEKGLPKRLLHHPISMYNVDRTKNSAGQITHCTDVTIMYQGHKEEVTAEITDLGQNQMILGYMWLKCHNPEIGWKAGTVKMT